MATTTLVPPASNALVTYDVTEAQIATVRAEYADLTADTPQGYDAVRLAIGHCRDTRVSIEKRRVELKAEALRFGRLVDAEAKRWTDLLTEIEEPLKAKKAAVDTEKARLKAEADAEKLRALEAEIRANQERQEADRRAAREAEEARLADERATLAAEREALDAERRRLDEENRATREAEEARLAAERAKLADEQRVAAEAARKEREALDAERRRVEADRQAAERAEFERQAAIQAEKDARARVEREAMDAAEHQARLAALRPDLEKVRAFASSIRGLIAIQPTVKSKAAKAMLAGAVTALNATADGLEATANGVAS